MVLYPDPLGVIILSKVTIYSNDVPQRPGGHVCVPWGVPDAGVGRDSCGMCLVA